MGTVRKTGKNYQIDAVFDGLVEVCVHYSDDDVSHDEEPRLTLQHFHGADWMDITNDLGDPINDTVCGLTSSSLIQINILTL